MAGQSVVEASSEQPDGVSSSLPLLLIESDVLATLPSDECSVQGTILGPRTGDDRFALVRTQGGIEAIDYYQSGCNGTGAGGPTPQPSMSPTPTPLSQQDPSSSPTPASAQPSTSSGAITPSPTSATTPDPSTNPQGTPSPSASPAPSTSTSPVGSPSPTPKPPRSSICAPNGAQICRNNATCTVETAATGGYEA